MHHSGGHSTFDNIRAGHMCTPNPTGKSTLTPTAPCDSYRYGLADIGYHYGITENGDVYQLRPINVRGAHVGGANTGTVGVVLAGNFREETVSSVQLNALRNVVGFLKTSYPSITHLAGHRDFDTSNTCPGDHLLELLPSIAVEYNLTYGTGGYKLPDYLSTPTPH